MKNSTIIAEDNHMEVEVRTIGYCAECGSIITDEIDDIYVDDDGNYFDCIDCAMQYHRLSKLEF